MGATSCAGRPGKSAPGAVFLSLDRYDRVKRDEVLDIPGFRLGVMIGPGGIFRQFAPGRLTPLDDAQFLWIYIKTDLTDSQRLLVPATGKSNHTSPAPVKGDVFRTFFQYPFR